MSAPMSFNRNIARAACRRHRRDDDGVRHVRRPG
jgi:hypothetical protein